MHSETSFSAEHLPPLGLPQTEHVHINHSSLTITGFLPIHQLPPDHLNGGILDVLSYALT